MLIVIITLVVRLIMIPSSINQQKGMAKSQRMQAKVRKIQEKYAGDQRKIQEETQALYQREGFNPMNAGCAPMAIQFILLFGLIGVIYYPLSNFLHIDATVIQNLISAVQALGYEAPSKNTRLFELIVIEHIDELRAIFDAGVSHVVTSGDKAVDVYELIKGIPVSTFDLIQSVGFSAFGISLGQTPKGSEFGPIWLIPILSTVSTVGSSIYSNLKQKQSGTANSQMAKSMGCMTVFMAGFSLYFVILFPAGIGVYWITSGILGLISSIVIGQIYSPKKMLARNMVDETIERRSREKAIIFAAQQKENKSGGEIS
ncbi:MAG: YidC/Oxa1 family membrane protein insertase [Clostridia bacterium]|nr:YidC/Oxa1 family membrane protein insertase [Clostridia bacterium]